MSEPAFHIVEFSPAYAEAWRTLNEAWLAEGGFAIEAKDRKVLDDPLGQILALGAASSSSSGRARLWAAAP